MRATTTLIALLASACTTHEVRVARPPTAFAGFDAEVALGDTLVLDATRSLDPDGDRLAYDWRLEARPDGSSTTISDARRALASLAPDRLGTYVASLTVSDGDFVSRDLVTLTAVPAIGTSTSPLALGLAPRTCNADADHLQLAPCGLDARHIAIDPVMLAYPRSLEDRLSIEWTFIRLPLGADTGELSIASPQGPIGELTFVPPRPGEYWIAGRLVGPAGASPLVVATVAVFAAPPPADARPQPCIDARATSRIGQIVLFDSRASYVPTSTAGLHARRVWSLAADPSGGADTLNDFATGCPVDECRRLIPSTRGTYLVTLAIGAGVTAVSALEVR